MINCVDQRICTLIFVFETYSLVEAIFLPFLLKNLPAKGPKEGAKLAPLVGDGTIT
jgi:hypothetical protein